MNSERITMRLMMLFIVLLSSCNNREHSLPKKSLLTATRTTSEALRILEVERAIANNKVGKEVTELANELRGDSELMALIDGFAGGKKLSQPLVPPPDFLINLNQQAEQGGLMPVIGRDNEISEVLEVLGQHLKSNPILIGDAGVGKTAIVEGLAQRIVAGNVPYKFRDRVVYAVDVGALMAGNALVGMIEHKVTRMLDFIKQDDRIILFIDEFHRLMGTRYGQGVSELLKPALSRDQICCIAATTTSEYQKHILDDQAIVRRFQVIPVSEPSVETALEIVHGLRDTFGDHHQIKITNEALNASVYLTQQFLPNKKLPDKALEVIDRASSTLQIAETAGELDRQHIAAVIAKQTGVPVERILQDPNEKIANLLPKLTDEIVGQDQALIAINQLLTSAYMGLTEKNRPLSIFMLAGPTGVGKTETAKALATALDLEIFRLDMSEYHASHTASTLIGSPPGYTNSQDGGLLTNKVRETPYLLILFDEIEKAHPAIYPLLLQVLEEGQLTDRRGNSVDFSNTIVIFTTNADHLNETFPREFLGRIDRIINYRPLTTEALHRIVKKQLDMLNDNLRDKGIQLTISDSARQALANYGFDSQFGARSLRSSFRQLVTFPLAEKMNSGQLVSGSYLLDFVAGRGWQLRGEDGSIIVISPPMTPPTPKQRRGIL